MAFILINGMSLIYFVECLVIRRVVKLQNDLHVIISLLIGRILGKVTQACMAIKDSPSGVCSWLLGIPFRPAGPSAGETAAQWDFLGLLSESR